MKQVRSADNPGFRELLALATQPRAVREQGRTLLEGAHLVQACLDAGHLPDLLVINEEVEASAEVLALRERIPATRHWQLAPSLLRRLSSLSTPAAVMAVLPLPQPVAIGDGDVVILDALQDPGNVGAVLRCAAAAGIRDVVLGSGCAGAWTPRTVRAGQGAHFALNLIEQVTLGDWLAQHPAVAGRLVATVVTDGIDLFDAELRGPVAWLIGNEGGGVGAGLAASAPRRISIAMAAQTESLNVAAAAAVCFFEARRQRRVYPGQ